MTRRQIVNEKVLLARLPCGQIPAGHPKSGDELLDREGLSSQGETFKGAQIRCGRGNTCRTPYCWNCIRRVRAGSPGLPKSGFLRRDYGGDAQEHDGDDTHLTTTPNARPEWRGAITPDMNEDVPFRVRSRPLVGRRGMGVPGVRLAHFFRIFRKINIVGTRTAPHPTAQKPNSGAVTE